MSTPRANDRPSVLLIICDDLTYGDLACHGNPFARTPHLDRLRTQSTRLERYCTGPLCTAARASLMTGRYPYRTRAIDTYCGRSMLDPAERTLAQVLRDAGYRTCISGKWHLGENHPMRPIDKGFDVSLVHRGGGLRQPANPGHWDGLDDYFNPLLVHNGRFEQHPGYCTDLFTDFACDFIRQHQGQPWFQYLAFNAPHTPCIAPDRWADRYRKLGFADQDAQLMAMVDNIDHNVGRVLATLDELKLADDTLVIFTSDHGAQGGVGLDPQRRAAGERVRFNADLRGAKASMYDGGIRTPCFWRWPGHFPADAAVNRVSNPVDFLPTLAAACGGSVPTDRKIDGCNLLPLLQGRKDAAAWPERHCFIQGHRGDEPVRYRNFAVVTDRYKLTRPKEDRPDELYDVVNDPGETTDLAAAEPERVAALRAAYDRWFDDVCSERPNNFDPPSIHLGTDAEPTTLLTPQTWRIHPGTPDGWDDHLHARWRVHVTTADPLRLAIRWRPFNADAKLTVTLGQHVTERSIPAGTGLTHIETAIPPGNHWLRAVIQTDGEQRAARTVEVTRA